jgi:hypothetical protein
VSCWRGSGEQLDYIAYDEDSLVPVGDPTKGMLVYSCGYINVAKLCKAAALHPTGMPSYKTKPAIVYVPKLLIIAQMMRAQGILNQTELPP